MKTMNMKLALSLVLALVMMMTVFALGVFADETVAVESGDAEVGAVVSPEEGAASEEKAEAKEETGAAEEKTGGFFFEPMNFVKNLTYMGTGMLGIFIVIGVIIVAVVILNKATSPKKDSEE